MSYKYLNVECQVKSVQWSFRFMFILAIFYFGILSDAAFAANEEDGSQTKTESKSVTDLTYSVLPREKEIDQGGSVWLDVQLLNAGKEPVTLFWGNYAYEDQYLFHITHNSGSTISPPRKRFMPSFEGLSQEHFKQVPAGGTLTYRMLLTPSPGANCQTYYFREPGDYFVDPNFLAIVVSEDDEGSDGKQKFRELWRGYLSAKRFSFTVRETLSRGGEREFGHVSVKGQVLDSNSRPIPDADVAVSMRIQSSSSFDGFNMNEVARQRTDSEGRFNISRLPDDCPLFELIARHPNYDIGRIQITTRLPKSDYEVSITLRNGMTIGGKVIDTAGNPVAGARITCYTDYPNRNAYTDEEGKFTLDGVVSQDGKTVRCDVWKRGWIQRDYSVSIDTAKSRNWNIIIESEKNNSFSGKAVYINGVAAAGRKIFFDLVNAEGRKVSVKETTTDDEGRFTAIMSKIEQVSGRIWLEEEAERYLPHGLWLTIVNNLLTDSNEVKLVFDRRGVIGVSIKPANILPADRDFRVTCYITDVPNSNQIAVGQKIIGSKGGTIVFSGLSTGNYKVEVVDPKAGHWNWVQEAKLALQDGEMEAKLSFQLPELHFGTVRARVLLPDGKTPLEEGQAWMDSSASSGSVDIRDGNISLEQVPVGNIWLNFNIKDYAPRKISGVVRSDQTTDFGDIILVNEEQGTGWVEGHILFDDGTPALGAAIIGDFFDRTPVKADGSFRRQLPTGRLQVAIDISGVPLWPRAGTGNDIDSYVGRASLAGQWGDKLFLSLDVKPGVTIQREIIIPLATLGNVEVKWLGDSEPNELYYALAVRTVNSFYSCYSPPHSTSGTEMLKNPITEVPAGYRILMLRTSKFSGYQESRSDERNSVFTFDPSQTGSISGYVRFSTGEPAGDVRLELLHPLLAELGSVRGLRSTLGMGPGTNMGSTKTDQNGLFRFTNVAPGRYVVSTVSPGNPDNKSIEVSKDAEILTELTIHFGR